MSTRLVIGCGKCESYPQNISKNPLKFKYCTMESVAFYVNGECTIKQPFRLNFVNSGVLLAL